MNTLQGKKIVLGVTGSIAAYKACTLIRLLVKAGCEVQCVITPSGKEFVTPLTLSTLTRKPCISEFFSRRDGSWNSHVELGLWADAMVVAPCTASTLGKMAHGIADNMLITTYLSMKAPVFIAPAMDLDMYAHPATQDNIELLKKRGNLFIEPREGELASQLVGKGRMEEPEEIVARLQDFFYPHRRLSGKRVMITAGPTFESIDPVRFLGNHSSGKMGISLASVCVKEGAEVELIVGPVSMPLPQSPHIHVTRVTSAKDLEKACDAIFPKCDVGILCAAVADYTPAEVFDEKLKREGNELTITFKPTTDIAAKLGKTKRNDQQLIGFALETTDECAHAKDKMQRKNLDFIVLNSLRDKGAGFGVDTNKISIIQSDGAVKEFPLKAKEDVACDIINHLCEQSGFSS